MRQWLKDIRIKRGETQSEFADSLKLPITTYASYEQGVRTPSARQAANIANKLHISWTLFFEPEVHETCSKNLSDAKG